MKRIICSVFTFVFLLACLTACGSEKGGSNSGGNGSTNTATDKNKVEKPAAIDEVDPANDVRGTPVCNLFGDSLFAMDGDTLYSGKGGIDKVKMPDGQKEEVNWYAGKCVSFYDGWVYYIGTIGQDQSSLWRIRPDGTEKTNLVPICSSAQIVNGWLYYVDRDLMKAKPDGSEAVELGDISEFIVHGSWIYYIDTGICRMDINGNNIQRFISGSTTRTINNLRIYGDKMLYRCANMENYVPGNIEQDIEIWYEVSDLDGKNAVKITNERLTDQRVSTFTFYDGFIYFIDYNNGKKLTRIAIDGGDESVLTDGECQQNFAIFGDRIICDIFADSGWKLTWMKTDGSDKKTFDWSF